MPRNGTRTSRAQRSTRRSMNGRSTSTRSAYNSSARAPSSCTNRMQAHPDDPDRRARRGGSGRRRRSDPACVRGARDARHNRQRQRLCSKRVSESPRACDSVRELEPCGGRAVDVEGSVELTEGTKHAVDATADAQEVVASIDSRMRLGEVIAATADRLGLSTTRKHDTQRGSARRHAGAARARRAALPRRLSPGSPGGPADVGFTTTESRSTGRSR